MIIQYVSHADGFLVMWGIIMAVVAIIGLFLMLGISIRYDEDRDNPKGNVLMNISGLVMFAGMALSIFLLLVAQPDNKDISRQIDEACEQQGIILNYEGKYNARGLIQSVADAGQTNWIEIQAIMPESNTPQRITVVATRIDDDEVRLEFAE